MKKFTFASITITGILFLFAACSTGQNNISTAPPTPSTTNTTQNEISEPVVSTPSSDDKSEKPVQEEAHHQQLRVLDKDWKAYGQFSEGLCPVMDKVTGMWGYVDRTGEYVIDPKFYDAMPFCEGLAAVKTSSGFYSFVDKSGKVAIEGNYLNVSQRFRGYFPGFADGYAWVSKEKGSIIIDREGVEIKEFSDWSNTYYHKGGLIYKDSTLYDTLYNKIEIQDVDFTGVYGGSSFDVSTKYLINGLRVVDANGSVVFTSASIPDLDSSAKYKIGITDDYVVLTRTINGITTSAVYDYSGELIIDYKYMGIAPLSKELFLVENNAYIYALIDSDGNEIVPFSQGFSTNIEYAIEAVKKNGILSFGRFNVDGDPDTRYFDIQSSSVKEGLVIHVPRSNGSGYMPKSAYSYVYFTEAGPMFCDDTEYGKAVFNEYGERVSNFEYIFPGSGGGDSMVKVYEKDAFLNVGIVPTMNEEKTGYTFAIYE